MNLLMFSFSSTAEIYITFLSQSFVFKNLSINLTSFILLSCIFVFCSKVNSSTGQTEANLPSAIFQRVRVYVQRLLDDVLFSTFIPISEVSSLVLLIGRTIFFHGKFCRSCSWLVSFEISTQWFSRENLSTYTNINMRHILPMRLSYRTLLTIDCSSGKRSGWKSFGNTGKLKREREWYSTESI